MSTEYENPFIGQEVEMLRQGIMSFIMEWIQFDLASVGGDTTKNTHLNALGWVRTLCDDIERMIDDSHREMAKGYTPKGHD